MVKTAEMVREAADNSEGMVSDDDCTEVEVEAECF
jgi:hypothetical protein